MALNRRKFIRNIITSILGTVITGSGKIFPAQKFKTVSPENKPDPLSWKENEINIAWIGHSTVLINIFGKIILTDPVFSERIGLYLLGFTYGPSRITYPAMQIEEIPKPDLVLLSHAHMDHMDFESLLNLTNRFPHQLDCITAYNTKDVIEELKWKSLQEIDWNELTIINDIEIKALEVKHFGWRFPWEKDRSKGFMEDGRSYNAYVIQRNNKKILFGGDTAYTDLFLKHKSEKVDIAIMPIGAYNPWKHNHCNPEEALIMADYFLGARFFVPIHCNTFRQGREPVDEPLSWLIKSSEKYDITIGLNEIGQTLTVDGNS